MMQKIIDLSEYNEIIKQITTNAYFLHLTLCKAWMAKKCQDVTKKPQAYHIDGVSLRLMLKRQIKRTKAHPTCIQTCLHFKVVEFDHFKIWVVYLFPLTKIFNNGTIAFPVLENVGCACFNLFAICHIGLGDISIFVNRTNSDIDILDLNNDILLAPFVLILFCFNNGEFAIIKTPSTWAVAYLLLP